MSAHRAVVTVPLGSSLASSRRYMPRSLRENNRATTTITAAAPAAAAAATTTTAMLESDGSSHEEAAHAHALVNRMNESAAASKSTRANTQRVMRRVMSFRPESLSPPNHRAAGESSEHGTTSSSKGRNVLQVEQPVPTAKHPRGARGGRSDCCPWALRNFVLFSVLFSLNHGCLSSILSLAPAQLQTGNVGSYGLGVFFICAVVMALFFAVAIVDRIGSKWAMVAAMVSSALNVCVFLGAFMLDSKLHANMSVIESSDDSVDISTSAVSPNFCLVP